MAKNFTYIDNSNVFIEGCRVSAVAKGLPGAATIIEAMNNRVVDFSWQIDYGSLHEFACGDPAEIGVDVAIAHQMTKDAYSGLVKPSDDEMTLVAGDKDYVPMVEDLVANKFVVHVVFWDHAATELKKAATKFINLNPYLEHLTKKWKPK